MIMAYSVWRRLKLIILEILTLVISVLFIFTLPTIVLIFSPIYLYRYCLSLYIKHFRKDLGKILSCGNATMASYDDVYGDTRNTTVIATKIKGTPDLEDIRASVMEKIVNAKLNDGTLKYPELQQYPVKYKGFYVWKPVEEDFNICNHVNFYHLPEQGKIYTDEDAADVESELGTKHHPPYRCPWEFIILPNAKSNPEDSDHFFLYFRTHHCVTDGFGISNLIVSELAGAGEDFLATASYAKRNIFRRILFWLFLIIRIPYDILHIPITSMGKTDSGFRPSKNLSSDNHASSKTISLPLTYMKTIRHFHKVSLTAVVMSAFIGGLRKMMVKHNLEIPNTMGFCCPAPMPGHPVTKLRIRASVINLLLPIGIEDPVKRLKAIEKIVQASKRSTSMLGYAMLAPIIGALPPFMIDYFFPGSMIAGCINNFPGPSTQLIIFNKPVVELHFSQGQSKLLVGLIFTALSYVEDMFMKITVNKAIFKNKSDINQFNDCIQDEFQELAKENV